MSYRAVVQHEVENWTWCAAIAVAESEEAFDYGDGEYEIEYSCPHRHRDEPLNKAMAKCLERMERLIMEPNEWEARTWLEKNVPHGLHQSLLRPLIDLLNAVERDEQDRRRPWAGGGVMNNESIRETDPERVEP
uniref:Uncharacterized protein n=1 Tax=viral metagenome TaxID=1070528 RepID=A0A6H1ZDS3_9ZZZZ